MTQKLDYSREEAMQILNNSSYTDEDKRKLYEQYMNALKKNRKTKIIEKLNEYARDIPSITKEIYISKLKEYESDDLSKPFEVIETELSIFEKDMKNKYNEYLQMKQASEQPAVNPEVPVEEESIDDNFDDTIFSEPIISEETINNDDISNDISNDIEEDLDEEIKPSLLVTDQISVINESTDEDEKPLFEDISNTKEIIPEEDIEESQKGSASAIILSIIAVIIGIVVMYSIIKLN